MAGLDFHAIRDNKTPSAGDNRGHQIAGYREHDRDGLWSERERGIKNGGRAGPAWRKVPTGRGPPSTANKPGPANANDNGAPAVRHRPRQYEPRDATTTTINAATVADAGPKFGR